MFVCASMVVIDAWENNMTVNLTIFVHSLTPEDLQDGVIQLRYVRFQDVSSITVSGLIASSLLFVVQ